MKNGFLAAICTFVIMSFIGCTNNSSVESESLTKELDISSFSVRTPNDWDWQQDQGIDTFIGRITNNDDTIYFDMGYLSFGGLENVEENDRTISIQSLKIDGISSLIVSERTPEEEMSGEVRLSVYIDSGDRQNLNRLYVFDPKNENLILAIFKSHKFK